MLLFFFMFSFGLFLYVLLNFDFMVKEGKSENYYASKDANSGKKTIWYSRLI